MISRALFIITVASLGILAGIIGFNLSDRDVPIRMISSELLTPVVHAGDNLEIRSHFVREKQCGVSVSRFLFDQDDRRIVLDPSNFPAGTGQVGEDEYITTVPIPLDMKPGRARYRTLSSYRCNFVHALWPIVGAQRERMFTVLPPKTK